MTNLAGVRYAGFSLRALAAILDCIVLAVPLAVFVSFLAVVNKIPLAFLDLHPGEAPSAVVAAFGQPAVFLILAYFIVSSWLYFALLESSDWQATVGKRLVGLRVTDLQGQRVTFLRASGRFLGGRLLLHVPYLGILYFLVDCACAGLTARKQALHDRMAGCLVLKRHEEPAME